MKVILPEPHDGYEFARDGVIIPPRLSHDYAAPVGVRRWEIARQKPLGPINYDKGAPRIYRCLHCRAYGVKLFRLFNIFIDANDTICADCAEREQKRPYVAHRDNIGERIPAVPVDDGSDFWLYPHTPRRAQAWWYRLPDRPSTKGKTHATNTCNDSNSRPDNNSGDPAVVRVL